MRSFFFHFVELDGSITTPTASNPKISLSLGGGG